MLVAVISLIRFKLGRRLRYVRILDRHHMALLLVEATQLEAGPCHLRARMRVEEDKDIGASNVIIDPLSPVSRASHVFAESHVELRLLFECLKESFKVVASALYFVLWLTNSLN